MNRQCKIFLMIISMFLIFTTGIEHNNAANQINPLEKETSVTAIMDVVLNKKEFLSTENGQSLYLKDFHSGNYFSDNGDAQFGEYTSDGEEMDYIFDQFCIIDMDGDGTPELVLEESQFGDRLLFHYENGTVTGFVFPFRGMNQLKKDASFVSSGGAASNYVETVQFSKDKVTYNALCICDEWDNVYRINGKNVSLEEADEYLMKQDAKENVEWHCYNDSNLGKYFFKYKDRM